MYCDEEEITVVRKLNRTLRNVNKIIRDRLQKILAEKDELFLMLCATEDQAGEALWKVWEQGKLTCDPDDYDFIVKECIQALSQKPNASSVNHCLGCPGADNKMCCCCKSGFYNTALCPLCVSGP